MKIKANTLEFKFLVDMVIGSAMFLAGACWDWMASVKFFTINKGFGMFQMEWCAFWGLYIVFTLVYWTYGNYLENIKDLVEEETNKDK